MDMMELSPNQAAIFAEAPVTEAFAALSNASINELFLYQQNGECIDSLTSKRLRQAILQGYSVDTPCGMIAEQLDEPLLQHDVDSNQLSISAVIMAGGFGSRLRPLTDEIPKPLLPIGERPLMELIMEQIYQAGIRHFYISTHYMPEKIQEYFADGCDFGVEITYVHEERPLGTAGALGLLDNLDQPLLVINGDILTKLDFRAMWSFHCQHKAALTLGVRQHQYQIPYGVIDADGAHVRQIKEKPKQQVLVNAGIYLLGPAALRLIPKGQRFDMTDLLTRLIDIGETVVNFPIVEYWLDIGQHADYAQAQKDVLNW